MRQAVILAGGKGTRLRERLGNAPKCLVDVDGVPLLGRQLKALCAYGFTDVVILVNYGADAIKAFCANSAFSDLQITLLDDGEPRGTAGALLHAFGALADRFLVVYGDTLFDIDLNRFWRAHETAQAGVTLFLHPNDHPFDSDLVEIDEGGRIVAFHNPPHATGAPLPNLVNAALYILERDSIAFWREQAPPSDIARGLFPAMLHRNARLHGYVSFEYIKDVGTPERLDKAVAHLRNGTILRTRIDHPQKAVFLDRDGTVNELRGHLARAEDFVLIDGAAEAIRRLNANEYRVVVLTNQPVIARGEATVSDLGRIHAKMQSLLGRQGAFVDAIYYCPHHPDSGFAGEVSGLKIACACRKPGTALVEDAQRDLNIDLAQSWFIGDSTTDMLTARRAGVKSILVGTGEAGRDGKHACLPDFFAWNLRDAVSFVTCQYQRVADAVAPIVERVEPGSVVLIGGLAKQGKSMVASALRIALEKAGFDAQILPLDGFIRDLVERGPGVLGRFDLKAVKEALAAWFEAEVALDINVSIYDRIKRGRSSKGIKLHLGSHSVLIVEGVPALHLDIGGKRRVNRVFIDGAEAARRQRVVDDIHARGMDAEEAQSVYEARCEDETPVIAAGLSRADFVITIDAIIGKKAIPKELHLP